MVVAGSGAPGGAAKERSNAPGFLVGRGDSAFERRAVQFNSFAAETPSQQPIPMPIQRVLVARACPRRFALPCWSIRPISRLPRARYATYRTPPVQSDCKFRSSRPARGERSRRPSPLSCAIAPTPCTSLVMCSLRAGASNWPRSQRPPAFPQAIPLVRLSKSAG
jgi:hypothetical protein